MGRTVFFWGLVLVGVGMNAQNTGHRGSAWGEILWGAVVPQSNVRLFGELGVRTNNRQAIYSLSVQHKRWTVGVRNFSFQSPSASRTLEIRPYVGYLWQGPVATERMAVLARAEWRSVVGGVDRPRLRLWIKPERLPVFAEALWSLPDPGLVLDPLMRYRVGGMWSPSHAEHPIWAWEWIPLVEFGGIAQPVQWTVRVRCRYEFRNRRML